MDDFVDFQKKIITIKQKREERTRIEYEISILEHDLIKTFNCRRFRHEKDSNNVSYCICVGKDYTRDCDHIWDDFINCPIIIPIRKVVKDVK
jgi:hypothetical protein